MPAAASLGWASRRSGISMSRSAVTAVFVWVAVGCTWLGRGPAPLRAQDGGLVMGNVFSEGTGAILAGVSISILNTDVHVVTDAEGRFQLPLLPAGDVGLR